MLDVLRDEQSVTPVDLAPQPTMDDLQQIAQQCTDSGIPTELVVAGGSRPDRPARRWPRTGSCRRRSRT